MKNPPFLSQGDTLGLIAPASLVNKEQIERALSNVKQLGLKAKYSADLLRKDGYFAGSDQRRAEEINEMIRDEEVKAIWCIRGGYGSMRLLAHIDYKTLEQNPKIILGYSDITALHAAINKKCNLITYHSPTASEYLSDYNKWHLQKAIMPEAINTKEPNRPKLCENFTIREGKAKGKLLGGNLSIITALCGTPYEIPFENNIIFIEEVAEEPYRVDRMISQLQLTGKLDKAAGIVFGCFNNCTTNQENTLNIKELLCRRIREHKIPAFYGINAGHLKAHRTLSMGSTVEIDASKKELYHINLDS